VRGREGEGRSAGEERNGGAGEARVHGRAAAVGHLAPTGATQLSGPVLPGALHVAAVAQGPGGVGGGGGEEGGQVLADAGRQRDAAGTSGNVGGVTQRMSRWTQWMVLICFQE
jgi:hypothetical protein